MIDFSQQHPILTVCVVFGISIVIILIAMVTAPNDEDNNEPPKFI